MSCIVYIVEARVKRLYAVCVHAHVYISIQVHSDYTHPSIDQGSRHVDVGLTPEVDAREEDESCSARRPGVFEMASKHPGPFAS